MTVEVLTDTEQLTEGDVDALINGLLGPLGLSIEELRSEADAGAFSSERARRAWFVVRGLGRS